MPMIPDAAELLLSILEARTEQERAAALEAATQAVAKLQLVLDDRALTSVSLRDFRIEDEGTQAETLEDRFQGYGRITVSTTGAGLMIDAVPPGCEDPVGIGIEFDKGSAKLHLFIPGVDDRQAVVHLDSCGAHISDEKTALIFRGEAGAIAAPTEWEPTEVPAMAYTPSLSGV